MSITFYDQISKNKIKTFLLFLLFPTIIISLIWVMGDIVADGDTDSIIFLSIISFVFSIGYGLIVYFWGDKITLGLNGAKPITSESNPRAYRIVENLCITAGLPMPKIYEINDDSLNAFATGRNPKNSTVAFTRGILAKLDDRELAGVAAHELSHIKNYDILLMLIAIVMVNCIQILAEILMRTVFYSGGRRSNRNRNSGGLILIAIGVYIIGIFVAIIVQKSISRKREFIADSNAALLTRDPEALASALRKISDDPRIEAIDGKRAFASFYIANPLKPGWFQRLLSTHPDITQRIQILENFGNTV